MEFRTWTQGVTFMTRCNYVANFFNELVYCLAVEKLLGITDDVPERARVLRVMITELNRISSHLIAVGTGGLELGASSVAEVGLREREIILEFNQAVTGLRMNNAWIRPGGVATDLPETGLDQLRDLIKRMEKYLPRSVSSAMRIRSLRPALRALVTLICLPVWPWELLVLLCALPACRGTCARPSPIAITTRMTSTSPPGIPVTVTGVSASAWKRWTSRCAFSSNASNASRTPRVTVIWSRTRTSHGRLS